jgi:hypothetical protein
MLDGFSVKGASHQHFPDTGLLEGEEAMHEEQHKEAHIAGIT